MNKTKVFNKMLDTYLNDNLVDDFKCYLQTDSLQIESSDQIEDDINSFKSNINDDLSTVDKADPDNRWVFDNVKTTKKFIKHEIKCLNKADKSDLFITDYSTGNEPMECRVMTDRDLKMVIDKLYNFLKDETLAPYKIKWLLKRNNISDVKLAKKVNLSHQQINFFRRGKRNILNMSLENALKFDKYYNNFIDKKLMSLKDKIYPEPV